MDWNVPFVIYRINANGQVEEVFQARDLKSAKYWLTYIAAPGDVLCKTPLHPKHSGAKNSPEYWSHKDTGREPITNEEEWLQLAHKLQFVGQFPEQQSEKAPH
jgi:hypothetical protein